MNESAKFESALSDLIESAVGVGIKRASTLARPEPQPRGEPSFRWISNLKTQEVTGWSRATMQRLRKDGKLPYSKVGASIFYLRADVDALLEKRLHVADQEVA